MLATASVPRTTRVEWGPRLLHRRNPYRAPRTSPIGSAGDHRKGSLYAHFSRQGSWQPFRLGMAREVNSSGPR
ncbi:protein of unknown function [Blastococcus saxobsidens DD2]|uniref:Uncharacterized protein n=1 Tax=Blastococcus saxobsidens (strain DD2) TaxID=1146883 RepID=H6RU63_BLASD|nr:protein of unknown function [Blastococcus saxobsidens DD2]